MITPPPELKKFAGLLTWLNALRKFCIASAPIRSDVCEIEQTDKGSLILPDAAAPGGAESAASDHPFKVTSRPKEGGGYEASVSLESSLYKSLRPNDKQAITGLDTWFDLIGNDAIWLGVIFDATGAITFTQIDSWGQIDLFEIDEDAWSGNNGYCEDDGEAEDPVHQVSRKLIAYSIAGDEGEPVLTQVMFRDQVLRDCNIDGRPARYPFDHEGGYPL